MPSLISRERSFLSYLCLVLENVPRLITLLEVFSFVQDTVSYNLYQKVKLSYFLAEILINVDIYSWMIKPLIETLCMLERLWG